MTDIRKNQIVRDPDEYLADLQRSRQHGADIKDDQRRSRVGNMLLKRVALPGVALLVATALIYEAGGAAISQEDHAPKAPQALTGRPAPPPNLPTQSPNLP